MGSGKAWVELLVLTAVLVVGFAFRVPGVGFLAVPLAFHLVCGLASSVGSGPGDLQAERKLSASRVWEGEAVEVEVRAVHSGPRLELVRVRDGPYLGLEVEQGEREAWRRGKAGEEVVLRYKVRCRRGLYRLEVLHVEAWDVLGYGRKVVKVPCSRVLTVLPRYERLGGITIAPRRTLVTHGTARSRRGGTGVEFFGVREYRPGDELRRLNWKALARLGEAVVVEYEEERAADVVVVLDVRARAYRVAQAPELLDYAVRGAAALTQFFISQGHRVGLLMYGAYLDWVAPGYGRRHGDRLLRELARARLGTSEAFAELGRLPAQLLRPGSQMALVSPLLPGDEQDLGALVARGYKVLVLVPDRLPLEARAAGQGRFAELAWKIMALERDVSFRRLYTTGVRPLIWDVRYPLAPQARAAWKRMR